MNKRIIPLLLLAGSLLLIGCSGTKTEDVTPTLSEETTVTVSVNKTASAPEASVSQDYEEPEPVEDTEPEADYSAMWADLPWPVEQIQKTILYATTTVNMRKEPSRKGEVLGTLEYNEEVIAIGRVNNYLGDKLDFYLLETGEYVCTDYFEAMVNIPDLGEGGYVFYDELYTYEEMLADLEELAMAYPDKIKFESVGVSVDGRLLCGVRIGEPSDKVFLIMASIHADEYINTALCMEQIDMYLQNWDEEYTNGLTYGEILNACNLYYMPCVNPDGMTLVQLGIDGLITEDAKDSALKAGYKSFWTSNVNGVDLNRNWDYGWNNKKAENASKPCATLYPGKKAFDQPETSAIRNWVNKTKGLCGVISYHTQGRIIYWYSNQNTRDDTYKISKKLAKRFAALTDYVMEDEDEVVVRGMEYNWFNLKKKIPCIQIETGRGENPLPYSEWRTIWRDNKYIGIEAAYQMGK